VRGLPRKKKRTILDQKEEKNARAEYRLEKEKKRKIHLRNRYCLA